MNDPGRDICTTTDARSVPAPPAPHPPAPLPAIPAHVLVDAIVCAAAYALKAAPETVRESVLAAFRRARELRVTVEDVESGLTRATAEAPAARPSGTRDARE